MPTNWVLLHFYGGKCDVLCRNIYAVVLVVGIGGYTVRLRKIREKRNISVLRLLKRLVTLIVLLLSAIVVAIIYKLYL